MTHSPSVPAPSTATTPPSIGHDSAACNPHAAGSIITAAESSSSAGHLVQLRLVSDERPDPIRRRCRSSSRSAGRARSSRRRGARTGRGSPARARPTRRIDAPHRAAEDRLDDDSPPVVGHRRRSRGPGRTGTTRSARTTGCCGRRRSRGRCRRSPRVGAGPASTRGREATARPSPSGRAARPRATERRPTLATPSGGEPRRPTLDDERLSSRVPAVCSGPIGSGRFGHPSAGFQSSVCQPRLRAIAASFASALTATGWPTTSSIGRSLAESA